MSCVEDIIERDFSSSELDPVSLELGEPIVYEFNKHSEKETRLRQVFFMGFTDDGRLKGRRESPVSVSIVCFGIDQLIGRARKRDYDFSEVLSDSGGIIRCRKCGHSTTGSDLSDLETEYRYCPRCERHEPLF